MPPELLTGVELARRIDVGYDELLGWARAGLIPSIRTSGGRIYFNVASVIEALRQRQQADVGELAEAVPA